MMNERGQTVFRYFLHDCWVSEFTAIPEMNSNANAVAIESLKIELEGWERDLDTKEPNQADAVPAAG
jgi:phage tail-like protein